MSEIEGSNEAAPFRLPDPAMLGRSMADIAERSQLGIGCNRFVRDAGKIRVGLRRAGRWRARLFDGAAFDVVKPGNRVEAVGHRRARRH